MYEHEKETVQLGIIGAGGMGRFYAHTFSKAGWKKYVFKKKNRKRKRMLIFVIVFMYAICLKSTRL
jgi:prephenate dehydrogenase